MTPEGELKEGESWLWVTFPKEIAERPYPDTGLSVEEHFQTQIEYLLGQQAHYVGGMYNAGGTLKTAQELRSLYSCLDLSTGVFFPMDGFHWGVSKEKSVFYAPEDSEFAEFNDL